MDSVVHTAGQRSLGQFILHWLLSWILPAIVSMVLVGTLDNLRIGEISRGLAQLGLFSLPALWAFGQGYVMRKHLRRARLWGALTGAGIVAGFAVLAAIHVRFEFAWWSLRQGIATWIFSTIGLADPFALLVDFGISGILFGLTLGALQTPALGMSRSRRVQWSIISAAAGFLVACWAFLSFELHLLDYLRDVIAEVIPLIGRGRYIAGAVIWSATVALGFALPTGWFMHWLLSRHGRADAAALVRRFE